MGLYLESRMITFATEYDENQSFNARWISAKQGQTILRIAASYGHPELAKKVADLNGIRSTTAKLPHGQRLKLPGQFTPVQFSVLCDDVPPTITDGYAVFEVVNRPGRLGINKFDGYNPIVMQLSLRFEAYQQSDGQQVETDIAKLERMAGRGQFTGAGNSPPAVVRCSATDAHGDPVWLIPSNYQGSKHNPSPPTWRITTIAWDATAEGVLRDDYAKRIRQLCQVTLTQYTPIAPIARSATQRARAKK